MAKTNQNHDSSSSSSFGRKRFKTFDKDGVADLNHDVLFLIMMRLSVFDFVAFSGVCKSWRSLALSNKNTFMASRSPLRVCIEPRDNQEGSYCCLEDIQGRMSTTILPHSGGRICFGVTCGYLILFGSETRDFWLVNPITRHQLHFPDYPLCACSFGGIRAILVFSPSISGWVLLVLHRNLWPSSRRVIKPKLSFCIAGKRRWNHVSSTVPILDLHVFKGKIYIIRSRCFLGELRLNLKRKSKSALLETNILQKPNFPNPWLVSSNESLFVIDRLRPKKVMELDFGEMKWVSAEKTVDEYAFFLSFLNSCVAVKPESWAGPQTKFKSWGYLKYTSDCFKRNGYFLDSEDDRHQMYFPHECFNANILDG